MTYFAPDRAAVDAILAEAPTPEELAATFAQLDEWLEAEPIGPVEWPRCEAPGCGRELVGKRRDARFCDRACKQRGRRARAAR